MIVGILLFQAVACAVLSGIVASNKNRDALGWGVIGLLFGLFGFIAALVVKEVKPEEKSTSSRTKSQPSGAREFDPDEHEKKCPMCAEYIKLEARRCKHCGHEYSEDEVERQIEETREGVEKTQADHTPERESPSPATEPNSQRASGAAAFVIAIFVALLLIYGTALLLSGG